MLHEWLGFPGISAQLLRVPLQVSAGTIGHVAQQHGLREGAAVVEVARRRCRVAGAAGFDPFREHTEEEVAKFTETAKRVFKGAKMVADLAGTGDFSAARRTLQRRMPA